MTTPRETAPAPGEVEAVPSTENVPRPDDPVNIALGALAEAIVTMTMVSVSLGAMSRNAKGGAK